MNTIFPSSKLLETKYMIPSSKMSYSRAILIMKVLSPSLSLSLYLPHSLSKSVPNSINIPLSCLYVSLWIGEQRLAQQALQSLPSRENKIFQVFKFLTRSEKISIFFLSSRSCSIAKEDYISKSSDMNWHNKIHILDAQINEDLVLQNLDKYWNPAIRNLAWLSSDNDLFKTHF